MKVRIGQRVRDGADGYSATVLNVGTIPETVECVAHRGLPGALVAWDRLDEGTFLQTPDAESLSRSWVPIDRLVGA